MIYKVHKGDTIGCKKTGRKTNSYLLVISDYNGLNGSSNQYSYYRAKILLIEKTYNTPSDSSFFAIRVKDIIKYIE